jgi:hypothetical protein
MTIVSCPFALVPMALRVARIQQMPSRQYLGPALARKAQTRHYVGAFQDRRHYAGKSLSRIGSSGIGHNSTSYWTNEIGLRIVGEV